MNDYDYGFKSHSTPGQEKTQVRLPGARKFCTQASENISLVVWWASEISLSSLVSDNFKSESISRLKTAR